MGPLVRDIYIIEKDFEGNRGSCMPRKHTHILPASLSDMPNNDSSSVSASLSLLWDLCLPLSSLQRLSLSLSSLSLSLYIRCALWYHPNHHLIFTNGIPTELRDVSLRITN